MAEFEGAAEGWDRDDVEGRWDEEDIARWLEYENWKLYKKCSLTHSMSRERRGAERVFRGHVRAYTILGSQLQCSVRLQRSGFGA